MSVIHSYSTETEKIIKELAKETQLTQLQKKGLFLHLLNKEESFISKSESVLPNHSETPYHKKKRKKLQAVVGSLRKKDAIVQSGCYERDNFIPFKGKQISERDKDSFIFKLAYGCPRPDTPDMKEIHKLCKYHKTSSSGSNKSRKEELLDEISDRMKFLDEMQKVSSQHYDKGYIPVIKQEIALKLKELQELEKCNNINL